MAYVTVYSYAGNSDEGGFTGLTVRMVIADARMSNKGLTYVKATFHSSSAEALTISKAYIQAAAGSGDAYDFSTTPVEILFSGGSGFVLGANSNVVSDATTFSVPASGNVVISFYVSGDATHDGTRADSTATNLDSYYKAGDDAATVNATGYSTFAENTLISVLKLEAELAGGWAIIWG